MPESPSTTTEVSAEEAKEPSVLKSPEIPAHDPEIEAFLDSAIDAVQEGDFETAGELAVDFAKNSTFWIDLGLIAACLIIAAGLYRLFRSGRPAFLGKIAERIPTRRSLRPFRLTLLFVSWIVVFIAGILELRCPILRTYSLILTCFVFINLPSKFIDWKSWMSVVSSLLFVTVALYILGLLDNTTRFLENYAFQIGSVSLSLLDLLKGLLSFGILMWFTGIASSIISRRLSKVEDLSPNVRVLFSKGIRLSLFAIAILVTMGVMGIQITTLAVFGGALGLGIGLGFQKVVSNMVSGIILLADKSIKPGDVIEIEETYGWINSVNLRYVSVITRDNKEHLIPNEDLITHPVINWSFSSKLVRVRAPF
ncbi:MAG: mechanosensitive ion channel domain-containing protein [Verrucomicrobiota bacterium]